MHSAQHGQIASFIWNIADDVLRDVFVRGKYRDVILPMTVIRRLDALLEPTKDAVLAKQRWAEEHNVAKPDPVLKLAARQEFYNTSPFTLRSLLNHPNQLKPNMIAYLDGFSPNVVEILTRFKFRNQLDDLDASGQLGPLIERFVDPRINLSPQPHDGRPGLDNHAMGTVFEELIRRFNEENNEEAGEHFTPRDVVTLMADLVFEPIRDRIESTTYLLYDGAAGTGGMLTVAEERLRQLAHARGKSVSMHAYGQEINPETWAIAQADLLIKGERADNVKWGSTLAADAFPADTFDFMLSNPPYGKSWKTDLDRLGGKDGMQDARFIIRHGGDPEYSLVTRSSDGQLMFLANMLSKMKADTPLGSRIVEVHNGSSLFTGDAGQGESNIRRWIIENDWLEAIIALPNNMFYNTGIATYIWVLGNRKEDRRKGKVQLIDATRRFTPRRKNLGQKNADLSDTDIAAIMAEFLAFDETETSKIFPNEAFGYWKVTVDRPLKLRVDIPHRITMVRDDRQPQLVEGSLEEDTRSTSILPNPAYDALPEPIRDTLQAVAHDLGTHTAGDYETFAKALDRIAKQHGVKLTTTLKKQIREAVATRDETAQPIVRKRGYDTVEYEPDPELRDTEQISLLEPGGIEGFFEREVRPHVPDAWIVSGSERIGYEISFTRYFYKPKQLRTLTEIEADIRALERETDGLLEEILVVVDK